MESHEDILKFDKNEILVKLEKGEGTLKIEKVALKKENEEIKKDKSKPETDQVELTLVKTEKKEETEDIKDIKEKESKKLDEIVDEKEVEKMEEGETKEKVDEKVEPEKPTKVDEPNEEEKEKEEKPEDEEKINKEKVDKKEESDKEKVEEPIKKEPIKEMKVEESKSEKLKPSDLDKEMDVSKQAAELKAMFPDLEVIQPLSRLSQIDTFVLREQKGSGALDFSETTVAQLFNNAVKWPKEYAIQMRLQHICHAVEYNEWPVPKTFTAYSGGMGHEFDTSIHETPSATPKRDTSTPMSTSEGSEVITITTDHCIYPRLNSNKKRKRHIAIDVETERAKLHALLNNAHSGQLPNPLTKPGTSWDNEDSEDSRRSTPVAQSNLQPPPAHQNAPRVLSMPYDLKYHVPSKIPGQVGASTIIPGTSSTLTPIDLSSG